MSIDLVLNNLETITFDNNRETFIIDGKVLKSRQAYINKQIGIYQSKEMIRLGSSTKYKDTKRIRNYRKKYNAFCDNYIHKCSKMTIDLAIEHGCNTIVIGDFSGIKQNNHAKLFVKIPHLKLIQQIEYKAKALGIAVVKVDEAYTSGCSILDDEPIDTLHYNKSRRVTRGMFMSNYGILINADVNGSYNIMKKYTNRVPNCLAHLVMLNMLQASALMGNSGTMTVPHYLDYQPKRLRVL